MLGRRGEETGSLLKGLVDMSRGSSVCVAAKAQQAVGSIPYLALSNAVLKSALDMYLVSIMLDMLQAGINAPCMRNADFGTVNAGQIRNVICAADPCHEAAGPCASVTLPVTAARALCL